MNECLAVILGGGRGTRLYPLTHQRSKPAVPIGGKYRLIDIPISNCLNSNLRRIFVVTQYNSESLNKHLSMTYKFDVFSSAFVTVLAAEQTEDSPEWFQGTADAVRQSTRHLDSHRSREVLILSGDQLYQMDYRKMLDTHRRHVADATVAVLPVSAEQTAAFGILKVSDEWIGVVQGNDFAVWERRQHAMRAEGRIRRVRGGSRVEARIELTRRSAVLMAVFFALFAVAAIGLLGRPGGMGISPATIALAFLAGLGTLAVFWAGSLRQRAALRRFLTEVFEERT